MSVEIGQQKKSAKIWPLRFMTVVIHMSIFDENMKNWKKNMKTGKPKFVTIRLMFTEHTENKKKLFSLTTLTLDC